MAAPEPSELAQLRAEIKKHRSPLYAGLFPLLDAVDQFAVATWRETSRLERRVRDLEGAIADQAATVAGLMPPGEFIDPTSPLAVQALAELAETADQAPAA